MTDNKIKMPVWGPYSKKYMGISKIINELADKGARYDFPSTLPFGTVQHPYRTLQFRQIITYGTAKTITLLFIQI